MKKTIYLISLGVFLAGIAFNTPSFAVKHVVSVGNFFFTPPSLNVNVGDTIRWVWSSGNHTTTSLAGAIPAGAASWSNPISSTSTSFEYPVTVAGMYNYDCAIHPTSMIGSFTAAGGTPTLSVAPSNRNVTELAGSTTFTVTSNSTWTSTSNATWCTVTMGGTGNGTITTNYIQNTSVSQRVATITVMVSGLPDQTVTVTQAGAAPTLSVVPPNQNVPFTAGSTAFTLTSNTTWTASSNATWCTVVSSGSGNMTVTANYTANPTNIIRIATITFTVTGLTPQMVTVTQAQTVGIHEQWLTDLHIYPNPTNGFFKVTSGSAKGQLLEVSVIDISGNTILYRNCSNADEYTFDISQEPKGLYFIRIKSENATLIRRIVLID